MTVEQRLDALDRVLLGVLPRTERLALVSQMESRFRELGSGDSSLETSPGRELETSAAHGTISRTAVSKRSRLALSSGVLGIVALVLLFAMPITYVLLMTIGEELGEFVSIALLSVHVLTVAVGGLVALIMGIAGLVSLSRRKGRLSGHGWAITGLCTAPLPTFIGGLMVLVTLLSLFAVQTAKVESSPSVTTAAAFVPEPHPFASAPRAPSKCDACTSTPYAAYPAVPANIPLPLNAAPSFQSRPYQCDADEPARPGSAPPPPSSAPQELRSSGSYGPSEVPATALPAPLAPSVAPKKPSSAAPAVPVIPIP